MVVDHYTVTHVRPADGDLASDAYSGVSSYHHTDANGYRDANRDPNRDSESNPLGDANGYANWDSESNPLGDANGYAKFNSLGDGYADRYRRAKRHLDLYARAVGNCYGNANTYSIRVGSG